MGARLASEVSARSFPSVGREPTSLPSQGRPVIVISSHSTPEPPERAVPADREGIEADRAAVLGHAEAALAAHTLIVQCAWCARYLVGGQVLDGHWLPCHLDRVRLHRERRVTHGACESCARELGVTDAAS